jgi:hypothetical protein
VYPDPPAPKTSSSQGSKEGTGSAQPSSPTSSAGEDDDDVDQYSKLDPIADEDEEELSPVTQQSTWSGGIARKVSTTSFPGLQRVASSTRQGSETPSVEGMGTKSSSPATATFSDAHLRSSGARPDWSFLPPDLQYYLSYFCENITYYHYCLVQDSHDFFRTILPNAALRNEALLYAVVAFAAYHHMLKNPNGEINEFLQYYNKSVTLLLGSLKMKEKYDIGTLLTILQLATIEVRLMPRILELTSRPSRPGRVLLELCLTR